MIVGSDVSGVYSRASQAAVAFAAPAAELKEVGAADQVGQHVDVLHHVAVSAISTLW
jgi:hypothetical protein